MITSVPVLALLAEAGVCCVGYHQPDNAFCLREHFRRQSQHSISEDDELNSQSGLGSGGIQKWKL